MEDEARELPPGWVRQYDAKEHHQFFVDTTAHPPRSIWQHPYDDAEYLASLSPAERARIQSLHRVPTTADIEAESSDDDHDHHRDGEHAASHSSAFPQELPERPAHPEGGVHRFGRKMKDRLTNTTHEERERKRQQRAEEEQRAYERHQRLRAAMAKAVETGEPQLVGKDAEGKDVYVESPYGANGYGGGYGGGFGGYGNGAYGYNPYSQGVYASPNARYLRPQMPYSRPYGYGYGGGLGLPLGLGLGGGLLGGSLLMGGLF